MGIKGGCPCYQKGLKECVCTLQPDENSGAGRRIHLDERERSVWEQMHGKVGARLARGFAMLTRSEEEHRS